MTKNSILLPGHPAPNYGMHEAGDVIRARVLESCVVETNNLHGDTHDLLESDTPADACCGHDPVIFSGLIDGLTATCICTLQRNLYCSQSDDTSHEWNVSDIGNSDTQ